MFLIISEIYLFLFRTHVKLRKVVSEETAFKKEVNSSSPLQYSLEKGVTLSTFSPDSLSQPKDTTNINIEQ